MRDAAEHARFEQAVLPHLGAAYRLARWITHNDHDAEDVVQEAYLRACKAFDRFRGGNARAWLLAVVRNTCYSWLQKNRSQDITTTYDENLDATGTLALGPERLIAQKVANDVLHRALARLPVPYREVLVLRELEGCSYKEIADIVGIPMGTVMSRLMRGRERLRLTLSGHLGQEVRDEV